MTAAPASTTEPRAALRALYRAPETDCVEQLRAEATVEPALARRIDAAARDLVAHIRAQRRRAGGLDVFLSQYALDTEEGVVLMCLAEALLRIPDEDTANRLIRDKIGGAAWAEHLGQSDSFFVNASTWGLMLTGRLIKLGETEPDDAWSAVQRLVSRAGEPVIRNALLHAMRILGRQFVMGRGIEEALARAADDGVLCSFDMLGEAALTAADAARYDAAYRAAIEAVGAAVTADGGAAGHAISVKLSALHPRYEFAKSERLAGELRPRLRALALAAKEQGIALTVDAEEAERLEPSLDVFESVFRDPALAAWDGLGIAVQAYQKRAPAVIDWLIALARAVRRRLHVRLVKGAYWDTEIKRAQERGLDGYPVYTRKAATDLSFIACARRLIEARDAVYPQFATHNARTIATVAALAGDAEGYEFQRLHGMGEALYEAVTEETGYGAPCRVYAPVGTHEDLLPYLVRRLLENGANTSFVNRLADDDAPIEAVVRDPLAAVGPAPYAPHAGIPLPRDLFGAARLNARGSDLSDPLEVDRLTTAIDAAVTGDWEAAPLVDGTAHESVPQPTFDPADRRRRTGVVHEASAEHARAAAAAVGAGASDWAQTPVETRAAALERFACLLEERHAEAMALCIREAGKTIADALAEVREAADYARYYAMQARREFAAPAPLPGPTGEANSIGLAARGPFLCISPWNFPLAIFTGQVTAALAAGNPVVAKPAEQTPLTAAFVTGLLHEAGVPAGVLHLVPGAGETVGTALVAAPEIAGVAFTGSTETARAIARTLAARDGPLVPLIAETGGQNAMIVDSSALPEQVVTDVLHSSFYSAGQRCSCLRVLFLQEEIAPRLIAMLSGAMAELRLGDPALLATDVGPVIDEAALAALEAHAAEIERRGTLHARAPDGEDTAHGTFFVPRAVEIEAIGVLSREVFGPILHIVRYAADRLDAVVDAVNATGYGLTLGVHSRISETAERVAARVRVGNMYVNRNMVGAVVGVQPFGGEGLSGTGPKAGGPRYLHRFATERTLSINTAAAGGNLDLLSLSDERRDAAEHLAYTPRP